MRINLSILVRQLNRSSASGLLALNHQDQRLLRTNSYRRFSEAFSALASMKIRMFREWSLQIGGRNAVSLEDAESLGGLAEHRPTKNAEIGDTTPLIAIEQPSFCFEYLGIGGP